jgi:hypothetical protein
MQDRDTQADAARRWGLIAFSALAAPVLIALCFVPWVRTQDGPLHLLNAHLMVELVKPDSPFHEFYFISWAPTPYWTLHLLLSGLMTFLPESVADRILMLLTTLGISCTLVWLRARVAGWSGMIIVAPLAILIPLNFLWLLGLYGFLLGVGMFLITLTYWWAGRDEMRARWVLILIGLVILGYLTHLVSFGLTVFGIVVLALTTPTDNWPRRIKTTAIILLPAVALVLIYRAMMRAGGDLQVLWVGMRDFLSPGAWMDYAYHIDLLGLRQTGNTFPFIDSSSGLLGLLSPTFLVMVSMLLLIAITLFGGSERRIVKTRRGWLIISAILTVGALFGPSHFGAAHGGILRERLLLIGLAAAIPALALDTKRFAVRAAGAALMLAAALQVAYFWEYALYSNRLVGEFMEVKPYVGTQQRVQTCQVSFDLRFRAYPLQNLPNAFGIGTQNFIWNNYAPCLYYFPIQFRDEAFRRYAWNLTFKGLMPLENPRENRQQIVEQWEALLGETHTKIDTLVVVGSNPSVENVNAQWYGSQPVFDSGRIRIFRPVSLTSIEK